MTLDDAEFLTVGDAANRLRLDREAVRTQLRLGKFSGVNLGPAGWRVRRTDLERRILSQRHGETQPL
jgi:hypothetical protein